VSARSGLLFQPVQRQPIVSLEGVIVCGQQLIGIMAVEQHFAGHPIQYGYAGRYLVHEHHVRDDGAEKRQVQRGVHHARVTAQSVTPAEHRSR